MTNFDSGWGGAISKNGLVKYDAKEAFILDIRHKQLSQSEPCPPSNAPLWKGHIFPIGMAIQDPGSSKLVFLKREKKGCCAVVDHARHGWNV